MMETLFIILGSVDYKLTSSEARGLESWSLDEAVISRISFKIAKSV